MRTGSALLAVCLCAPAVVAEEFPYRAYVADEAVLVRCGPGESYYPTSRLLQGAKVEVYRHEADGWCAIRPPEGEFSLIAGDRVQLLPGDDLLEVVGQEAAVWVGTSIAKPEQHRWQIHLQPGEQAVVLGVRSSETSKQNAAAAHWYKIAPPAGEFRWIHREALTSVEPQSEPAPTDAPPPDVASDEPAVVETLPGPNTDAREAAAIDPAAESPLAQVALEAPIEDEGRMTREESIATPAPPSEPQAVFVEATREIHPAVRAASAEAPIASSEAAIALPPESFDDAAAAIDLDLTLAVAQDLRQWRLGPLLDRAARLQALAASPEEHRRAELLRQKIEQFQHLADRYRRVAGR